ncbi:MAG TPA: hypothetical protein VF174_09890 [Micromonosporaceae bacterium]
MPYSALRDKKTELIRKARDGSVFAAPITAAGITNLTSGASADLITLPPDWEDVGFMTTAGASYGRETEQSDINSFGSVEPTRSDITRDTMTLQFSMQETKRLTVELASGADLSSTQAAVTTGEFSVEKPNVPGFRYYRVLGLFVDETNDGEIYIARYMPRARVTEFAEQAFNNDDEAILWGVTMTGFEDSTVGYSHRWIFGGPGWLALLNEMGITQATS